MIQIQLSNLDFKRSLMLQEAHKLKRLNDQMGSANDALIRALVGMHNEVKGNLGVAFIQECVASVDALGSSLDPNYVPCAMKWTDDMLSMWQGLDGRCKKLRPVPGDLVIMHHVKHNKLIMSGQLGIIMHVNKDLTVDTLEASMISQFEEEAVSSQTVGIHNRLRTPKGTSKMRVLGYFSPWIDR
jgi:hypothetical protein